ncbi:MAG: fibrobacter succinogenes major paralogous domain-containing protein [Flavobacteriales bacterium]|nr:fibrobacter succinogenes major paralogous domain-containing protein [Flavobacteriales bacterium]
MRTHFAIFLLALAPVLFGQATMNCHFTTGAPGLYELSTLDSVVMDTAALPPMLRIYRTGFLDVNIIASQVDSLTYSPGGPTDSPLLVTLSPVAVTGDCAIVGSYVADENGSPVAAHGVCWSTSPLPTVADDVAPCAFLTGVTNAVLMGLAPNTTYYARAYATNGNGTAYGNQVSFTTSAVPGDSWLLPGVAFGTMTDTDGNAYATITVGGVEWMAENLCTTTYATGAPIPNVTDGTTWTNLTTGAWCHYENNAQFEVPYGKLYNWSAVTDPRNVCPTGWHVATDAEWTALTDAFGGLPVAGDALKSMVLWTHVLSTTNASGFSALPGGDRVTLNGQFLDLANTGYYWTASAFGANSGWARGLGAQTSNVTRTDYNKKNGLSVRCVQD